MFHRALHLASAAFLQQRGEELELAPYDVSMRAAAAALGIPAYPLP